MKLKAPIHGAWIRRRLPCPPASAAPAAPSPTKADPAVVKARDDEQRRLKHAARYGRHNQNWDFAAGPCPDG
jgi:hypothetical protein